MTYRRIGLLYHPRQPAARELADSLRKTALGAAHEAWLAQTGDEAAVTAHMGETDLLVCVGGDGTVLWAARAAVPHSIPIVGINMGHLGFLSELDPEQAHDDLRAILDGGGIVEARAMLECTIHEADDPAPASPHIGLNDVVVGRAAPGRPVYLAVNIDGVHVATVRADAIIVSTATGSTAYSLSAGGPVLMPQSHDLLLTPVSPHLSRMRPLVLPAESLVEIQVTTDLAAIVSVDGQFDTPVTSGCVVGVRQSAHRARFIRLGPPSDFFQKLADHLNLSTHREV